MRIVGLKLQADGAWPALEWNGIAPGLNALYGPNGSGKTSVADFLGHVLFGKRPTSFASVVRAGTPQGEITVDSGRGLFRLRRYHERPSSTRLTVAGLDGSSVEEGTIRNLVGGLSPTVLAPLCAVNFADAPQVMRLLTPEFVRETQSFGGWNRSHGSRRTIELAARRDLLAQELETRIANERRVSTELDGSWRELDRRLRHEQQQQAALEQRLHAVETALAETDARLRYRRLELNIELHRQWDAPVDQGPQLADLDAQIAHWRKTLGDLSQREAVVRGELSQIKPEQGPLPATLTDQAAWLTIARQLAADLSGEVARLARASDSQRCVCGDAHPRLRPIAETIERQLDVLETLIAHQRSGLRAGELAAEIENLGRTQCELRHYLEQLLDRREALSRSTLASHSVVANPASSETSDLKSAVPDQTSATFSAADAQQLESRRQELEQERFDLVNQLRDEARTLRDLRSQRDAVERERAALLSARSIEHVQRELADVQRRLEQAASGLSRHCELSISAANALQASDFLAQLTDGGIVRLILEDRDRQPRAVDRNGRTLAVESLTPAQRDQVYLSVCLALLSAAAEHGTWLPLVLDEPFLRLDASATAALTAVLDDFCRRGHQVVVLTERVDAVDRLTSLGTAVQNIGDLRRREFVADANVPSRPVMETAAPAASSTRQGKRRPAVVQKRKKSRQRTTLNGKGAASDHSDAA
jgi:DNA repair exonuclease SbcCD ATPase subunit